MLANATVFILEYRKGFAFGCLDCGQVYDEGQFAIVLNLNGHRYFIGPDQVVTHCGKPKPTFLIYATREAAKNKHAEVKAILERDCSTHNLTLVDFPGFPFPEVDLEN